MNEISFVAAVTDISLMKTKKERTRHLQFRLAIKNVCTQHRSLLWAFFCRPRAAQELLFFLPGGEARPACYVCIYLGVPRLVIHYSFALFASSRCRVYDYTTMRLFVFLCIYAVTRYDIFYFRAIIHTTLLFNVITLFSWSKEKWIWIWAIGAQA